MVLNDITDNQKVRVFTFTLNEREYDETTAWEHDEKISNTINEFLNGKQVIEIRDEFKHVPNHSACLWWKFIIIYKD